ncbi:MAG: M81 family metallopeptidase, partial [Clostridia bacterium]|nr:M81 family metallopeptidase [Clostridia bacterium]
MRIATGGFEHETNSFCTIPVTKETVRRATVSGEAFFERNRGVRNMDGGTIDACRDLGIELVAVSRAELDSAGPTERAAYEEFRDRMVEELWRAHLNKPLDAVALNIHGAGIADGYPDLEGDLLRAVRERFGREIPIGITLDLHANVTPEMMELSDVTVGYKTYPHVDTYESAYRVVELLHESWKRGKRFYQALVRLPWHIAPACGVTLSGGAGDVMQYDRNLTERTPGVFDVTFFHGFPYADVPFSGASVTAVAETPDVARGAAEQATKYAWSVRHGFTAPINSPKRAMDLAEKEPGVVVINESSDNPGGGAPGDGTHLLREMLKRNLP